MTSDLDEYAIAALAAAPADSYGVGTSLVTGSGAPTAGLVYKMVARADDAGALIAVAKRSTNKVGHGGRKWAVRRHDGDGVAETELLGGGDPPAQARDRLLLHPLVRAGEVVHDEPLDAARSRCARALADLPPHARQLSRGEPAIPTVYA